VRGADGKQAGCVTEKKKLSSDLLISTFRGKGRRRGSSASPPSGTEKKGEDLRGQNRTRISGAVASIKGVFKKKRVDDGG